MLIFSIFWYIFMTSILADWPQKLSKGALVANIFELVINTIGTYLLYRLNRKGYFFVQLYNNLAPKKTRFVVEHFRNTVHSAEETQWAILR